MNRWTINVWIGAGLVVLGLLLLLQRFGIFSGAIALFWAAAFLLGGGYFLYRFFNNMRGEWWAAIPGFALAGIGLESLFSGVFHFGGGGFFLGGLGVAFFAVYFSDRERWWAIIPGGVMLSLAFTAVLSDALGGRETGGVFLLGLGLTFILVALLASMQWAWIPGVVLLVLGAFIGTPFIGAMNYVWPAALILGGILLILQFGRKR